MGDQAMAMTAAIYARVSTDDKGQELKLSPTIWRKLRLAGVQDTQSLLNASEAELWALKGIGRRSLAAILKEIHRIKGAQIQCEVWTAGKQCESMAEKFCMETHVFVCANHTREYCLNAKESVLRHELKEIAEGIAISINDAKSEIEINRESIAASEDSIRNARHRIRRLRRLQSR